MILARGRTRAGALAEGVVAGVLFGTAAILIRFNQDLGAFSIAFWRLIIACLTLIVVLVLARRSFSFGLIRSNLRELLILSFFLALHFVFFASAVADTTILNATVLVNTSPIFSMLVSSFVFKLKPSRIALMGLMISFVGACIIAYAETGNLAVSSNQSTHVSSMKGDLEAVFAALVEAFYLNFGRKLRSQMNLLSTMIPLYFLTAIIVGILSLPTAGKILILPVHAGNILALIVLGMLPTATAHTLYFSSLSNLKSFETATMALLEPVGATILGIGIFQEIPAPLFAVGAALTLIGILFVVKNKG
jgi:drug/metabolite transporter (DMT)-like permease